MATHVRAGSATLLAVLLMTVPHPSAAQSLDLGEVRAACETDNPYLAVVCQPRPVLGFKDPDWPVVVAFRDTPADSPQYVLAREGQIGTVSGLAYSGREEAPYAAAYHKRATHFGPGGPGAIYRISLQTGGVDLS